MAFENPEHSYTLPAYQTACGAFDIFNHVLDNYYLAGDATFDLVLEMQEAVMRTVVKWDPGGRWRSLRTTRRVRT